MGEVRLLSSQLGVCDVWMRGAVWAQPVHAARSVWANGAFRPGVFTNVGFKKAGPTRRLGGFFSDGHTRIYAKTYS